MKVVVGWILVTRDGNGGLGSCEEHHGVGVKKDVKRGSEADCASLTWLQLTRQLLVLHRMCTSVHVQPCRDMLDHLPTLSTPTHALSHLYPRCRALVFAVSVWRLCGARKISLRTCVLIHHHGTRRARRSLLIRVFCKFSSGFYRSRPSASPRGQACNRRRQIPKPCDSKCKQVRVVDGRCEHSRAAGRR